MTVRPRLRVRTKRDYTVSFLVDHGQRNATFVTRPWTPLHRWISWADAVAILPEPDFDIIHAVNSVPILTRRPYVLTFEDYLPRVPEDRYEPWLERRLLQALTSPRCVGLLAISEYARRQARLQSRDFAGRELLEAKTELMYPTIEVAHERPKARLGEPLQLLFVGRDFLQKGGPAVVNAHERLREAGVDVRTTVVSSLRWNHDSYIGPPSAPLASREHGRLRATPGLIHHAVLPNDAVLDLMRAVDFLILPTLHDTFGFVALEALASGTPVIATATNALPEIVDDGRNGYLLDLPLERLLGRWAWAYRTTEPGYVAAYEAAMVDLGAQIARRVTECRSAPERYGELSAAAIATIRERFAPAPARDRLEELYERCRERLPARRRGARASS